jgi:proteasome accessory factor A
MDVVVESMELIRCYLHENFVARWNYALENPRLDMRGFEVDELRNDKDEMEHLQRDRQRKIPLKDLKSDLLIHNGARLYNDHTHPEFSTPECYDLFGLLAFDRAGERILLQCAQLRTATRGGGVVRLYKNNTDFEGHSYGAHENFLIRRDIAFEKVIEVLLPFVVTRQIYAGAGKVGVEQDTRAEAASYQLAQRSDFFEVITSVDTMQRRPLINSRDEPHADPAHWRRLHLIFGDANMSEWATTLKVGALALVLDLLEADKAPVFELADPVGALKHISRDRDRQWPLALAGGTFTSALEVQAAYLDAARALAQGRDAETDWVLAEWQRALDALGGDAQELLGLCDWVTKKWLLDAFAESEGLDWEKPDDRAWLQSQDLEYHNIDPQEGLYLMLEQQGQVTRLLKEEEVLRAMVVPPPDTRAYFRGVALEKFSAEVVSLNWDSIEFKVDGRVEVVDLKTCVDIETAAYYNGALDAAQSVGELLKKLAAWKAQTPPKGEV